MQIFLLPFLLLLSAEPRVVRSIDVAPVWSGHTVGFDMVTRGNQQFVAFYDAERRMTIGVRRLDSTEWKFARLDSRLGWDSHNSIAMVIDDEGYIHIAGNMHAIKLVYFRTARPLDIDSFEAIHKMVGREEDRCTYPVFFRGAANELIFTYRDGGSGSGNQIYNVWDQKVRAWKRLLDTPLTDGQGRMNAYLSGPVRGPDGYFHLIWVWRDTPDCSTNHDLSYARSKDLVNWETSSGKPQTLPMRVETAEVIDPVPPRGGIINGCARIGWDSKKRPIVSYHKFDAKGNTQVYFARMEEGRWIIRQISDWDYRWYPQGGGSIESEIRLGSVSPGLHFGYTHVKYGRGAWRIDEATLKVLGPAPAAPEGFGIPAELERPQSTFPGMQVRQVRQGRYLLRWETLGPNRDRARTGPLPEPAMLKLYEIEEAPGR